MLSRSVMSACSPIAGPQFEMPLPATPMPTPYLSVIALRRGLRARRVAVHADDVRAFLAPAAAATSRPMPLPAPTTAIICRASSFSGGMRWSLASSSSQYSMSKASCSGSAVYSSIASAPRMTSTAQL